MERLPCRLAVPQLVADRGLRVPAYVSDGMRVIAPYHHPSRGWVGLRCVVATACGTTARVVNDRVWFDAWFNIDELRVEPADA